MVLWLGPFWGGFSLLLHLVRRMHNSGKNWQWEFEPLFEPKTNYIELCRPLKHLGPTDFRMLQWGCGDTVPKKDHENGKFKYYIVRFILNYAAQIFIAKRSG